MLANFYYKFSSAVAAEMLSVSTLKRKILLVRQREETVLPNPNNSDFIIPEQHQGVSDGELFFHYDSSTNISCILIFTAQNSLDYIEDYEHWFSDKIISVAPHIFT